MNHLVLFEKFLPNFKSLFKKKDLTVVHKKSILNLQKLIDLGCDDVLDINGFRCELKVNEIMIEDHNGKQLGSAPRGSTCLDSLVNKDDGGLIFIKLIQDESNELVISIEYDKEYKFGLITWYQMLVHDGIIIDASPMCYGTEKIYDTIRKYLDRPRISPPLDLP